MKKTMVLRLLVIVIMAFSAMTVHAQPCDPGDPDNPIPCPIDGGVSLLIAAGIGIAGRKAYLEKKKKATTTI